MDYIHWNEKTITDFSTQAVSAAYADGYVFTRLGKGVMHQTRSVRIRLADFALSSENKRILKKTDGLTLAVHTIPEGFIYDWTIHKMGADFYAQKFQDPESTTKIFSANKIRELITDKEKSNFNCLLDFLRSGSHTSSHLGYCIAYKNDTILHYSYPFYDLHAQEATKDTGMGMMIRAIQYAKEQGLTYVYLGSLRRPADAYKLQFSGVEWFGGTEWSSDIDKAKESVSISS